jgi:dipeptidyl aminopeptidase/acylaminoacyl peptidase
VDRIAFASTDGHIYTVRRDGSGLTRITPSDSPGFPGGQFTWPVWSPDGGSIIYSAVLESPNPGYDVSLVRAAADGSSRVTLYEDEPSSEGIGNGVPHFAMWSPDGKRLALIAGSASGLFTVLMDPDSGVITEPVATGAPIYMAWSPDSRFLIVHLEDMLFVHEPGVDGGRGRRSLQMANPALNYYSPQFAPADNRFAFGDVVDGQKKLIVRTAEAQAPTDLGAADGILGFRWSPAGDSLAVLRGPQSGLFDELSLTPLDGGAPRKLVSRQIFGAWWSPDGRSIAVAAASRSYRLAVDWSVIDVATGAETHLAVTLPTPEFEFVLSFFDQYDNATRIWSPDSKSIVVSGAMLAAMPSELPPSNLPPPPRGDPERVWVLDAAGAMPPVSVGDGFLAFWSPR